MVRYRAGTMTTVVEELRARAADGTSLAVSVHGDGLPLLLIPGLGATRVVFDPIVPALVQRDQRVIVFDPRGTGESEPGAQPISLPLLATDAAAVLDATDVSSAAALGASMGGAVAQHLALDHAARVECLLLAATAPIGGRAVPADPRVTDALLGKGARTPADAYRRACTVLYSPQFQRTHQDFIEEQVRLRAARPVRAHVFAAQMKALRAPDDSFDRLPSITAPTLIMHGTEDAVTPVENARLLAGRIPAARTRWFEGCGHLFFHERPEESARVVYEFLRDHRPAQEQAAG
jgi:3-oxoadipate enol-lactonase